MENVINKIDVKVIFKVLFASFVMAVAAQIYIPLPIVNISGQTLGMMVLALCLPTKLAVSTMILYILEGVAGLPVFTGHRAGLPILMGTSGGFLIGFVFASAFISHFAEQSNSKLKIAGVVFVGLIITYIFGLLQLSLLVPADKVLEYGLYPFITGEIVKLILVTVLTPMSKEFFKR
ncbi:MAG: biotin transporter BioY [Rickettsiales bacterium]|jgi:biotin transport system substrate-specific component|nr:biotin transporter BioY [Rickettsiales bacterium]